MLRTIFMKRILLIGLALFLATMSGVGAQVSSSANHPLGVFNFDFSRLGADEANQISELKSIGYGGLVLQVTKPKQLEQLHQYQAGIGDESFEVYAGYVVVFFGLDIAAQNAHIDNVIKALKKSNAKLWLILRLRNQKLDRAEVVDFLRSAAERTKAEGVELVIYPHWNGGKTNNISFIESAEEAIPYVEEVQNDNVFISLHLAHEIKAGNGDRLDEVAAKIKPWLRLPSINGADEDAVNEMTGWKRGIQALTMGDYDSSRLLKALKSVGYKGPVILHTWGLQKAAADHHQTSFKRFQEMKAALGIDLQTKGKFRMALPEAVRNHQPARITPEKWRAALQKIRSATLEEKIDYLLDRAEIEDIITTYAYSVDTRNWPLHGELFKDSFKQRRGDGYRDVDNQERLEKLDKFFQRFSSTQHLGFPLVIMIEGDTAYATASLNARHYDESGDPMDNTLLFGQYEFWFERTSEGWKVNKLAQVNRTRINTSEAKFPEED